MELVDSRRLTGPNLLWDHPGAVLEVALEVNEDPTAVWEAWRGQVTRALEALGLEVQLTHRTYPGGVSLAFAAPIDALYTAMQINDRQPTMTKINLIAFAVECAAAIRTAMNHRPHHGVQIIAITCTGKAYNSAH